jgi:hypothetical protein
MHFFATAKPEHILEYGKMSYAEAAARGPTALPARDVGSVVR